VTGTVRIRIESSILGPILQRIAPWKVGQITASLLTENRRDFALVGNGCISHSQPRASRGITRASGIVRVVAAIDGILKGSDVPTVLEVAVQRKPGGVTCGPDKRPVSCRLIPASREVVNVPSYLIKEVHEIDRMVRGAYTIVQLIHIGSMRGMIR